jgi:ABC-type lipoprotein export system ATPase subunit
MKAEIEKSREQVQNLNENLEQRNPIVYIISAPSGSGKSTLVNDC